jgi:hypothetical protein
MRPEDLQSDGGQPPPCRPLVRYRCANAQARRSAPGKGWKLNRSKPALLAEAPELLSQECRFLAELRHVPRSRWPHPPHQPLARPSNR